MTSQGYGLEDLDGLVRRYWTRFDVVNSISDSSEVSSAPWDVVEDLCRAPGTAATVVLALLGLATTMDRLAYLAAGPLEDVVKRADSLDSELLEEQALVDDTLMLALRLIYLSEATAGGQWRRRMLGECLEGS